MEKLSQFCLILIFLSKHYSCDSECSAQEFKCGDTCIHRTSKCYCGAGDEDGIISNEYENYGSRCRLTGKDTCYQENGHGFCMNGTRGKIQFCGDFEIERSKSCNGTCIDAQLFGCATTGDNCVDPTSLCHGYSVCNDKSDLKFCKEQHCQYRHGRRGFKYEGKGVESLTFSQCEKDEKLPTEHSECYLSIKDNEDGRFNCLGRQDENNTLAWKDTEEIIQYDKLKLCKNETGIQCGSECVPMVRWCTGDISGFSCTIINSAQLCGNHTFWKDKPCFEQLDTHGYGQAASRCTGRSQHCFAPDYANFETSGRGRNVETVCVRNFLSLYWETFWELGGMPYVCQDKSDQVFPKGKICSRDTYVDLICEDLRENEQTEDEILQICKNRTIPCTQPAWLEDYDADDDADPHNCRGSCAVPGPNCQACTNPDYFNCTNSGKCIHPSLLCDGHPQCDYAEDENLDICYDTLVKQGDIKGSATLICPSIMYPKMMTVATVCDGIVECDGLGGDEKGICKGKKKWLYFDVWCFCFMILCFAFAFKWFGQKKFKNEDLNKNSLLLVQLDEEMFLKNHVEGKFKIFNVVLKRAKLMDHKNARTLTNQLYYNLELEAHGGDIAKTKCCIKNYLDPSIFQTVVDDLEPGLIQTYAPWVETFLEKLDDKKWMRWLLRKVKEIATIYIDLSKDSLLVFSIILAIGGISSLIDFPTKLTSIIVFCFLASIFFPLLMCSLLLAEETIDESRESLSWKEKIFIFTKFVLLSFLNPMILIDQYETNKEKQDEAVGRIHDESDVENVLKLQQKLRSIKAKYLKFVRIDLQLETMFQTAGQILLLLLTKTKTSTTGGLEKIFEDEKTGIFLYMSIGWSVKTCFMEYLKSRTLDKPFMLFSSKILVLVWAICVATKRILVLVFFFVPSFGLLDLLYHWKYELTPFAVSQSGKMTNESTLYLYNSTTHWAQIDRWMYADPKSHVNQKLQFKTSIPPPYTLYTGLSLGQYFTLFWVILAVHTIIIALTKWFMSQHYRKTSYLKMFIHALENLNFPDAFVDWDTLPGTIEEHRDRFQKVTKEVTAIMAVNFIFNLLLLVPLFYTVTNIWERHDILTRTIGTKAEENFSNERATFWLTAVTTLYLLLSIVEPCLYLFYNYKAHPWKDIIQETKDTSMMLTAVKEGEVNPNIEEMENSAKTSEKLGEIVADQKANFMF